MSAEIHLPMKCSLEWQDYKNKWLNTFDEIHDMFIWHTIVLKVDEIDKSIEDEAKHILGNFEQIREVSCSKGFFNCKLHVQYPIENEILWCHYYQNICDIKNLDVKVIKSKNNNRSIFSPKSITSMA